MSRTVFGRYDGQDQYHYFYQNSKGEIVDRECSHNGSKKVNADVDDDLTLAEKDELEKFFDVCSSCDRNYDLELRMSQHDIKNEVFHMVDLPQDADVRHSRVWSKILRELRQ